MSRRRLALAGVVVAALAAAVAVVVLVVATRDGDESASGGTVPSVVGLAQTEAENRVVAAGFSTQIQRVRGERPAGTVVAQRPGPASRAAAGAVVELTVSAGANGAEAPPTSTGTDADGGELELPNGVGRHQILAGADIEQLGVVVDTVAVVSNAPCGEVVAQAPAAGTRVARGSTVVLRVSRGPDPLPRVTVPGLLGAAATARQDAREFGFTVRTRTKPAPSRDLAGQVLEQRPGALSEATELDQITLVIGR